MSHEIIKQFGPDPITLLQRWYDEAVPLEPNDPEAICLATADKQGRPSARMVLLKEISHEGFKFHTNTGSEKGQDILENPHVSFCLYWKSTRKQIRVTGIAAPVSTEESDTYFKTRPRARAIGAWASDQSESFEHETDLSKSFSTFEEKFKHQTEIPRPPQWQGFRIIPDSIEFWIGHPDRLHTRFIYRKDGNSWIAEWLYP
jgi:pyridoxamine 5'-phosphate oxidase